MTRRVDRNAENDFVVNSELQGIDYEPTQPSSLVAVSEEDIETTANMLEYTMPDPASIVRNCYDRGYLGEGTIVEEIEMSGELFNKYFK